MFFCAVRMQTRDTLIFTINTIAPMTTGKNFPAWDLHSLLAFRLRTWALPRLNDLITEATFFWALKQCKLFAAFPEVIRNGTAGSTLNGTTCRTSKTIFCHMYCSFAGQLVALLVFEVVVNYTWLHQSLLAALAFDKFAASFSDVLLKGFILQHFEFTLSYDGLDLRNR